VDQEIMITVYQIGSDRLWTGNAREIADDAGLLGSWTRSPPPSLQEGEFARWIGGGAWEVVSALMLMAEAGERLKTAIVTATEAQLNAFAATRGYDSILSASTYATSTVPQFAAEAAYCVGLRDATWATLYQMLAEVQAGTRPMPTSFEDIASELPTATAAWPA
jgi:hypothetical protein